MDVSVIIVNYNTAWMTKECIESIFKYTNGPSFEVIVVDNASNDNSDSLLGEDKRLKYVKNKSNVGFGRANNIGASIATGKYLFCLNSDTILQGNAINSLFKFSENNKSLNIGTLGVLLVDKDGIINGPFSCFPKPYLFFKSNRHEIRRIRERIINGEYEKVDYVCGADMFIGSSVFKSIAGFDERFFMYCEEIDLQKRLCEKGFNNYVINNTDIIHLEGGSFDRGKRDRFRRYHMRRESLIRYLLIHFPKIAFLDRLYVTIIIIQDLMMRKVNVCFQETLTLLLLPLKFKLEKNIQ